MGTLNSALKPLFVPPPLLLSSILCPPLQHYILIFNNVQFLGSTGGWLFPWIPMYTQKTSNNSGCANKTTHLRNACCPSSSQNLRPLEDSGSCLGGGALTDAGYGDLQFSHSNSYSCEQRGWRKDNRAIGVFEALEFPSIPLSPHFIRTAIHASNQEELL